MRSLLAFSASSFILRQEAATPKTRGAFWRALALRAPPLVTTVCGIHTAIMAFLSGLIVGVAITAFFGALWLFFSRSDNSTMGRPQGLAELKRFPDPIALTEKNRIVVTNMAFEREFPDLAGKKTWKGWMSCVDESADLEAHDAPPLKVDRGMTRADSIFRSTDGRILQWTAAAYPGLGRKLTLNIIRDISAWAGDPLEQARFLNKAAHELKTPVTAIKGYSELLDMYLQNKRPVPPDFGKRIVQQSNRLVHLVNQILDVGRLGAGRLRDAPEAVRAGDLIEEAVERVRTSFPGRTIDLSVFDNPEVLVDPLRFENLVRELLYNALQYSLENSPVTAQLATRGDRLEIEVADEGIGVPAEEADKVFDRFYRGSNVTKAPGAGGFGLGLFLASSVATRWGGSIRLSATKRGTKAVLSFPMRRPFQPHPHPDDYPDNEEMRDTAHAQQADRPR